LYLNIELNNGQEIGLFFALLRRGTNEERVERMTTETLSLRCKRERCRLKQGVALLRRVY